MLELRFLGGLSVFQDGVPLTNLKSRKGEALLCYLAVTGRRHTRSSLAGLFWPDMPEANARMNLRKVLNRLKRLSPYLVITRESISFDREAPHWLDVADFEASAAMASDTNRLQYAVSLYEGDFLEGFDSDRFILFNHWVLSQRARLRELAFRSLQNLIAHFNTLQNYPSAISHIRQLLTIESWHEETHRKLMRLLALSGQRSTALAQYESCRRILAEELGVDPAPATIHLYEQIKAGGQIDEPAEETILPTAQSAAPAHNLPQQLTPLIGREGELAEIRKLLANPDCQLLTLVGPGGIGKTRLAIEAAQQASSGFSHGVFFVPLAHVISADNLVPAIASALNLQFYGRTHPREQLLDYLRPQHSMLVLDNFEHLMDGVQLLSDIVISAPEVTLLVTSREQLNIHPEWSFNFSGLSYPESVPQSDDPEAVVAVYGALKLLVQRARRSRSTFQVTAQNLPALIRICQLVEGLPLSLELAASWIPTMSCHEIANGIAQSLDFLTTTLRDIPARHRSLRAVFQHSWSLLSTDEQAVVCRLSVFRGGFTRQAASKVAGATLLMLASLVGKSLVKRVRADRYEIHELLRQFAHDQLKLANLEEQTADCHLTYFSKLVEVAERQLLGPEQFDWLQKLETEHDNICGALTWCEANPKRTAEGLRLTGMLPWYWFLANRWREGYQWTMKFLQRSTPSDDPENRAYALFAAGGLTVTLDDYNHAKTYLQESAAIFRSVGNQLRLAWSLNVLGIACTYQGEFKHARKLQQESLAIFQDVNEIYGSLWSLEYLGQAVLATGDYQQAYTILKECLALNQQIGFTIILPQTLIDLARVERCLDELDSAYVHLQESLTYAEQLGVLRFKSQSLSNLGWITLLRGAIAEARGLFIESLEIYLLLGDNMGVAEAIEGLACIDAGQADWKHAAYLLGATQALREQISVPVAIENRAIYNETLQKLQHAIDDVELSPFWLNGRQINLASSDMVHVILAQV